MIEHGVDLLALAIEARKPIDVRACRLERGRDARQPRAEMLAKRELASHGRRKLDVGERGDGYANRIAGDLAVSAAGAGRRERGASVLRAQANRLKNLGL